MTETSTHKPTRQNASHDFRPLRDRLETEFATLLAPDLAAIGASQVYVVLLSETSILGDDAQFRGLFSPAMPFWFRAEIGARWRGAGPTFLLNDISPDCQDPDSFVGIAAHELAHAVDAFDAYIPEVPNYTPTVPEGFAASVVTGNITVPGRSVRHGHGPSWLRICCHLTFRMQQRGWPVWLPQVIDHDFYAYSSTSVYRRALGDECERLEDIPLSKLCDIPSPTDFIDLWNADLAQWPDGEF